MRRKTTILTLFFCFCTAVSFAQTADFTALTTSGCSPLVVNFQDQSTGNITGWSWDFGNGGTSTLQHPSATYFTPGTYTVRLTITGPFGTRTTTKTAYITVYGKPSVNFSVSDSTGCFPLRAQFNNLSVASPGTTNTSWLWDFGDGTQSTEQNPLHVYLSSGNYTVTLKVTNDKGCTSTLPKVSYIRVSAGVRANFGNTQPAVCRPPIQINFSDSSTGPGALTWFWDFGDGNTSTAQNPSHVYSNPGAYTVKLAVTSSAGCSDTLTKDSVLQLHNINTNFQSPDTICVGSVLNLQNTSTPTPLNSVWDFDDGTSSSATNPTKIYNVAGLYNIRLHSTYDYCMDSFSKPVLVVSRPIASFSTPDTFRCQPNLTTNFQDASSNAVAWEWDFGDGTISTQQNPTHTYTSYGSFDVRLVVTNAFGCTDTLTRLGYINVRRPQISFSNLPQNGCIPFSVSPTANISTTDIVTSYLWEFSDGFTSTSANPSHTLTVQGVYGVKLTITTSTGCTDSLSMPIAVTVGRKPIVNFTAVPNPVCAFQNVQFTDLSNEGDQWYWDFGDGGGSSDQHPIYQYSDTGYMSVLLVVTNSGCRDSLRIDSFIRIKPPIARYDFQTDCSNRFLFQFIDSSIGATSWHWDFGDGTTSTQQSPAHTFPAYGTYNVTLTVSNDTCSHSFTRQIVVLDESPDFHATNPSGCKSYTVHFVANVASQANIAQYLWDFGDGSPQWNSNVLNSGNIANNYYTASGSYTVTLITTDIYGCRDTVVKPNYIQVNGPVAGFSAANPTGCQGMTVTFNDLSTSDGISSLASWTFDFGDGSTQTFSAPPFTHTYQTAGTFSVKMIVTDAAGCRDSLRIANMIITSNPQAEFLSVNRFTCPGANVRFFDTSHVGPHTRIWDFGDGGTSTAPEPLHQYASPGLYTVTLVITDQYGCSDTLIKPDYITVSEPVASFTVNDSISSCTPFEVQFTNTSTYWNTLVWDLGGGTATIPNPIQFYTVPGVYPVTLIVTSFGGCKDTATANITVYDTAGANITYLPLDGCKPLSVNLSAFSPGPMDLYTWDFGDGVLISDTANTINHVFNSFGNFVPKVILTDPAGCIIPVSGVDTIRIIGATAKFGLDNNFFCDSGWVNFTDSTLFNDPLASYNWDFGDGTTATTQEPIHQYTSPGIYSITLSVQTASGCVDTFRIVDAVKVVESPLVRIGGDSSICVNDSLLHSGIFIRPDTSIVQWNWTFPNGNTSSLQYPEIQQYTQEGNFVVTAIATNSSGCRDTATKSIVVHPLPTVNMPPSITMQAGFPVTLSPVYSPNVIDWVWSPPATLSCFTCPQPVASPKFTTNYEVAVMDSNGCKNVGRIQVIVICENANVFIPNTFSPNGDGSNDVFYVRGKGLERVKSLRIFNRWGEVVFERQQFPVNDPSYGWDGRYKGNKPVPDVYIYQVEVFCENSQLIRFEGNVALIQ